MAALASSSQAATSLVHSLARTPSAGAAASEGASRTCLVRKNAGVLLRSEVLGASLKAESRSNQTSARRTVCAAALAGIRNPREDLLKDIEERWERIEKFPLEGVPFTYEEFEQALSKYDFNFNVGEKVKGIVFKSDNHGALIDIGAKAPAFLPTWESSMYKVKNVEEVGLVSGLEEEFMIIDEDDEKGRLILSLRKLQEELAWERCKQLLAEDVTIRGKVLDLNKGGLIVLVEGLRGFIPTSQVASRSPKELLLGKELPLKLMEVDEERVRLVLSNRKAAAESQISSFEVGDVVLGVVQAVKPYGAFIDVGGINGLLHISQISHDRLTNVESVLQEGDKLKVMILSHDRERGRLSFTTKKLEPTPGDMLRNPALVYEKAEEMASLFREQVARAEAVARAEDQQGFLQSSLFGFQRGPAEEETKFDLSGL